MLPVGRQDIDRRVRQWVHWGEPWGGYRQFCQAFLYPLLLQAYRNVPFQPFLRGSIEGIPAAVCSRLMSLYRSLRPADQASILPLVIDITDPSPNLGWRGLERKALVERGRPDLVLCLALLHHLVIGANIPLGEVVDWLASLGGSLLVEFVSKQDPMARGLLRNKPDQYAEYEQPTFERLLSRRFDVVSREPLAGETRVLYFARNRGTADSSSPDPEVP